MEDRKKKKENELIISYKEDEYSLEKTIDFFTLKIIDMFDKTNKVVISCTKRNLGIANTVVERIKPMGLLEGLRYKTTEEGKNNPIEHIKIPLELTPSSISLKKDRKPYD